MKRFKDMIGYGSSKIDEDHTVDSVMTSFTTAIANLKKVEQKELDNMEFHTSTIEKAQLAHATSKQEAERAKNIAFKLGEIVGH